MLKLLLITFLPFLLFFGESADKQLPGGPKADSGTLRKLVPESGTVSIEVDLSQLGRNGSRGAENGIAAMSFNVLKDSFLPVLVFNNDVRGPLPGSLDLSGVIQRGAPARLRAAQDYLVIESQSWGSSYEFVLKDKRDNFVFFGIEGHDYAFDPAGDTLAIRNGRLVLSKEFADTLGSPASAGRSVGTFSLSASMRAIEVTEFVDGEVQSEVLPASEVGTIPGPDVVVGALNGLAQFGSSSGTQVGLAVGTDSCNFGTVDLNWFANPANDHPVIPQNLYRMSGGPTNDERFEQVGQSSVKHAFTALTNNICGLGCNGVGSTHLGSGCSDPYSASLNSGSSGNSLGSRAWINPFTGAYPRNDSATPNNSHTGHTHTGPSHRILTEISDLNTSLNPGATYYAEGQYVTPHEYAWCQSHPGQCNMNNNVSYRRYNVSGTASPFTFSSPFATERAKAAVRAWTDSTQVDIEPAPGLDGVGIIAYKVTNPSPGVWHYEYALYNQNMDRAIRSFSLPMGAPVTLSNVGFHAPPQHPGWAMDGTVGNLGYSSTPWASIKGAGDFVWSTETFAQNPNANAIRWATLYNFRFDSNFGPQVRNAVVGFFKTGAPILVNVAVPTAMVAVSGRVTNDGRGVTNARVSIQDAAGFTLAAFTDRHGNFHFNNVPSGGSYTISVVQRRFSFAPQTVDVNDAVSGLNFAALP